MCVSMLCMFYSVSPNDQFGGIAVGGPINTGGLGLVSTHPLDSSSPAKTDPEPVCQVNFCN